MDFLGLLNEFVTICGELKEQEEKVERIKKNRHELERILLVEFAKNKLQNMHVAGKVIYLRKDVRVQKKTDKEMSDICDVLRSIGGEDLVREQYAPSALTAFVKELKQSDGGVPPELLECVNVVDVEQLVLTKG